MASDDTKTRLLAAAGLIFAEKGYQDATVREICLAAEMNLASVNYYFGDKERLYIETVMQASKIRAREIPLPVRDLETPPQTRLRDFIHTLLTRMIGEKEAPWQVRLMMREVVQPSSACKHLVEDYFRPQLELLRSILDELLPAETATHVRSQVSFSIVGQCFFYRVAAEVVSLLTPSEEMAAHYSVEQLAEHISHTTLASLGHASPLNPAPNEKALPEKTIHRRNAALKRIDDQP